MTSQSKPSSDYLPDFGEPIASFCLSNSDCHQHLARRNPSPRLHTEKPPRCSSRDRGMHSQNAIQNPQTQSSTLGYDWRSVLRWRDKEDPRFHERWRKRGGCIKNRFSFKIRTTKRRNRFWRVREISGGPWPFWGAPDSRSVYSHFSRVVLSATATMPCRQ